MINFRENYWLLKYLGFAAFLFICIPLNSYAQCNFEVSVAAPSGEVKPSERVELRAVIKSLNGARRPSNLRYNWTLDSSFFTIQGNSQGKSIFVKATDIKRANKKRLTATVTVIGFPAACNATSGNQVVFARNQVVFRDRSLPNVKPGIQSISFFPTEIVVCSSDPEKNSPKNGILEIIVNGSDPDGDDLTYNIALNGGRIVKISDGKIQVAVGGLRPGTYSFTVSVDDGDVTTFAETKVFRVTECLSSNSEIIVNE